MQKLWETVAICSVSRDKPIALLADLNARMAALQASFGGVEWAKIWERLSSDKEDNSRGRAVIQELDLYKLCIFPRFHNHRCNVPSYHGLEAG
jgi:hypothetical protein